MAKNQDKSGPDTTSQPARGEARATADSPPITNAAPDPRAPAQQVSGPQTLPPIGSAANVPSTDIREAERIKTAPGSSAQANSGAAFVDQIFGKVDTEADIDDEDEDDTGPKLVVLHTYVSGPGGGPYIRGKVITVRDLLGPNLMTEENRVNGKRHLRRYLEGQGVGPAVRPATNEESKMEFVTFVEGEAALSTALDDANARADAATAEAERLREELRRVKSGGATSERASSTRLERGKTTDSGVDTDALLDTASDEGQTPRKEGDDEF